MKKFKKLIPALAMLLVSASVLGTSTYAWFSMNTVVSATGMEVRATTGDNLMIAHGTTAATAKPGEDEFTTVDITTMRALLEPVSTIDGVSYFYTAVNNVQANGDAIADTYVAYDPSSTTAFNTNYSTTGAVGFVDYAFFLKATNADTTTAKDVNMTALTLTYGGTTQTQKAFRVAVFVNDMGETGSTAATAPASGTLLSVLRDSSAGYFTATNKAVDSTTTLAEVDSKIDDAVTIGTVAATKTNYYKVVVRLWLEGEDTTCNNSTFASLTDQWALDLTIQFGGTAVSNLTQAVTAAKVDLSAGPSSGATAFKTITINGAATSFYEIAGNAGYYLTTASTAVASGSYIYKFDSNGLPVDVTNQCTLPTAP